MKGFNWFNKVSKESSGEQLMRKVKVIPELTQECQMLRARDEIQIAMDEVAAADENTRNLMVSACENLTQILMIAEDIPEGGLLISKLYDLKRDMTRVFDLIEMKYDIKK